MGPGDVKAVEAASGGVPVKVARVLSGTCMFFGLDLKLPVPLHERVAR